MRYSPENGATTTKKCISTTLIVRRPEQSQFMDSILKTHRDTSASESRYSFILAVLFASVLAMSSHVFHPRVLFFFPLRRQKNVFVRLFTIANMAKPWSRDRVVHMGHQCCESGAQLKNNYRHGAQQSTAYLDPCFYAYRLAKLRWDACRTLDALISIFSNWPCVAGNNHL